MIEPLTIAGTPESPVSEWFEVRNENDQLLFEVSVVTGRVRVRRRGLTTVVDVEARRQQRIREMVKAGAAAPGAVA